jgi:putative membrane protein
MTHKRTYNHSALFLATALLALAPLAARAQTANQMGGTANTPGSGNATSSSGATSSSSGPTDGQIEKIVHTANDGEIKQGKLAKKKSDNADIKSFANMMIKQHEDVNKQIKKVAKAEKIKPQDSPTAETLKKDSERTVSELKSMKGSDFDKAYIDAQVKNHEEVLNSIDNTLLPNAKDPQLRAALTRIRPAVQNHLDHAKRLQATLEQGSPSKSSG